MLIKRQHCVDLYVLFLLLQFALVIPVISLHSSCYSWIDVGVTLSSKVIGADTSDASTGACLLEKNEGALHHVDDILLILDSDG